MALFHRATLTPTKSELIAAWIPTQPWGPSADDAVDVIGSYRFDDPDGRVGLETHLVTSGDMVLHVPVTYHDEPLDELVRIGLEVRCDTLALLAELTDEQLASKIPGAPWSDGTVGGVLSVHTGHHRMHRHWAEEGSPAA